MRLKIFKILVLCCLFAISKNTVAQSFLTKTEALPVPNNALPNLTHLITGGKIKDTNDQLRCRSTFMNWVAGWHPSYTITSNSPLKYGEVLANMRFQLRSCNTIGQKKNERIDEVNFDIDPKWNKPDSNKPATLFSVSRLQDGRQIITITNAAAEVFFTEWGSWRWRVLGTAVITIPKPGTTGIGKISFTSIKPYCRLNTYSQCDTSSAINKWPKESSALGNIIEANVLSFKASCKTPNGANCQ